MTTDHSLLIVMGVSGVGKTTIGQSLAESLGFQFVEADDFHSSEAKARMGRGEPLDDAMRAPWIEALCAHLQACTGSVVLAFSGLRSAHRSIFRELGFRVLYFHLSGDPTVLRQRLERRTGHFMSAALLDSQLDALQMPECSDVVSIGIDQPVGSIVRLIQQHYQVRLGG